MASGYHEEMGWGWEVGAGRSQSQGKGSPGNRIELKQDTLPLAPCYLECGTLKNH